MEKVIVFDGALMADITHDAWAEGCLCLTRRQAGHE